MQTSTSDKDMNQITLVIVIIIVSSDRKYIFSRLSLSEEVDLKKLRFFTVVNDGGSPLTSPVDNQLIQAQKRVRRTHNACII